jgi:outer membrane protein TolC
VRCVSNLYRRHEIWRSLVSTVERRCPMHAGWALAIVTCLIASTAATGDDKAVESSLTDGQRDEWTEIVPPSHQELVIDLGTALRLAEVQNPRMALAREIVCEAVAQQREARGLWLPTLTAGTNYHLHSGVLQTSFGEIRKINEQSVYVGGGTRTLAAESVAIPAVRIFAHAGDAYYLPLAARQMVTVRAFESHAVDNLTLLDVADCYLTLVAAEARREALQVSLGEVGAIVRAQKDFARVGQGRDADFHRARAELLLMRLEEQTAQEESAVAAAELSRLLHLDPSIRLITPAGPIELLDLVDESSPVENLVGQALHLRPEVTSRSAEIGAAEYRLQNERMRPWLPLISVGFSGGAFGGGSNRQDLGVSSFYSTTAGRTDFDVWAIWTVQNLGAGNHAWQGMRKAEREQAIYQRALALAQIRREVGERQAQARARHQTLTVAWMQLSAAEKGAHEELRRTRAGEALPLESLNSVTRLAAARLQLLAAVIEYNRAEMRLFVALGTNPNELRAVAGATSLSNP